MPFDLDDAPSVESGPLPDVADSESEDFEEEEFDLRQEVVEKGNIYIYIYIYINIAAISNS